MQGPDEIRRDLPPELGDMERDLLVEVAMRLQLQRPPVAPGFRQDLRQTLLDESESRDSGTALTPRPARGPAIAYAASGFLLLAVSAIGLAGAGPFAPG